MKDLGEDMLLHLITLNTLGDLEFQKSAICMLQSVKAEGGCWLDWKIHPLKKIMMLTRRI